MKRKSKRLDNTTASKSKRSKLRIERETLRNLSESQLGEVAGGNSGACGDTSLACMTR
jgi:hypothetical protein